jgi:hypothetical protein
VTTSRGRTAAVLVALAVAGFVLSLVVHAAVMPHTSGNADEVIYRFQAEMYRDGRATIPDDGPVFRPWMSGVVDGERMMVFPAGWPAVLAAGRTLTGSYPLAVALVVAGLGPAMWWFLVELTRDRRVALLGSVATLVCPLVIVHSGTMLSYVPALVLEALAAAAVLRVVRTRRLGLLVLAGAALGGVLSLRPLDSALVGLPLLGLLAWSFRAELRRRALPVLGLLALGALVPVAATLAYNHRVTGSPLTFPIEAAGGNNAFGAGARNIAEGTPPSTVTVGDLLRATGKNLLEVPKWMPLVWLGAPLAVVGAVVLWRRARAGAIAVAAIALLLPLAYAAYWGTVLLSRGRNAFGPFYYSGAWLALAAGVATGVVACWDRWGARAPNRRLAVGAAALAGLVALALVAVALRSPFRTFDRYTERAEVQLDLVADLPDDSMVVLPVGFDGPWILYPWNQYANAPQIDDGSVLYAADAGEPVVEALDDHADRDAFQLLDPEGPGNAGDLELEAIATEEAPAFRIRTEVLDLAPAATYAYLLLDGTGARCPVAPGPGGPLVVVWRTDLTGITAEQGCAGPVETVDGAPQGQRSCAAGVQGGDGADRVLREERFWCRPGGQGTEPTIVVPGEPRVGSRFGTRQQRWTTLTREEADRRLEVSVTPLS